MTSYGYLVLLWILFGGTHSLLATAAWKHWVQRNTGSWFPYYRLLYSLISFLLLGAIIAYEWQLPAVWLWRTPWPVSIVGGVLATAGLLIIGICIRKYFFYLSGVDVFFTKGNSMKSTEQSVYLEKDGLHRYVRHPLYVGTLLTVWAFFLLFAEWHYFITCCMITLYTCLGTVWEERKLLQEFGEAYKKYQQKVPRWGIRIRLW